MFEKQRICRREKQRGKMKKLIYLTAVVMFVFTLASHALSSPRWAVKDLKAFTGDIKIFLNGKILPTRVEPFIMQDSSVTMVPLRDLAEALGLTVIWDEQTKTINIGGVPLNVNEGSEQSRGSRTKVKIESIPVIRNIGPFYQKKGTGYSIAGRNYHSGVAVRVDSTKNIAEAVLDLNQKYLTMEGVFGVDDETMNSSGGYRLSVLADGRELFTSDIVKPSEYPRTFKPGDLNLEYVNRLTFTVQWQREVGIGSYEQLVAVLGNFNFYLKEAGTSNSIFAYLEPTPPPPASQPAASSNYVTVQRGDTLFRIAQNHNTTVERLLQLNPGLEPDLIKVGQKIRVR
jgi:LysM repeat protein